MLTLVFAVMMNVTVQECLGEVCVEICNGSISTAPGLLNVYRVNCSQSIFGNGFD